MCQNAYPAPDDEGMVTRPLKNGQHVFTLLRTGKIGQKISGKALERGIDCVFCIVETQG